MALLVTRNKNTIDTNTNPITSSYVRLSFVCDQNGKDIFVSFAYYENKEAYNNQTPIQNCDIPVSVSVLTFEKYPPLFSIHEKCSLLFTQYGYDCEIVDVV